MSSKNTFLAWWLFSICLILLLVSGCTTKPTVYCGDKVCGLASGENCNTCPLDCGSCPSPEHCGNKICDSDLGEDNNNCPSDCNAQITIFCGDGVCNGAELCGICEQDCGQCPPNNKEYCKQALYSGDPQNKIDVIYIPDRYTDLNQWAQDVNLFLYALPSDEPTDASQYDSGGNYYGDLYNYQGFFQTEPLKTYKSRFNVWYLDINYFEFYKITNDTGYLPPESMATAKNYADNCFSDNQKSDFLFIIVNNDNIVGPGGFGIYDKNAAMFDRSIWWIDSDGNIEGKHLGIGTQLHEFGHGFVNLADEYFQYGALHELNYFDLRINVDIEGCPKWCPGEINTNGNCYQALNTMKNCLNQQGEEFYPTQTKFIINEKYGQLIDCMKKSNPPIQSIYVLEGCNFGVNCDDNQGCYWNAKGLNTFKPTLTSIMNNNEIGYYNPISAQAISDKIIRLTQ